MKNKVVISVCYGGFGLSDEAMKWLEKVGVSDDEPLERHDPRLVKCVETLGSQKASGEYADLRIEEIDGDMYRVCEYDGFEWVETPSSIHWTKIKEEE